MRWRRLTLAAVAGALVAALVWLWPPAPRWHSGPGVGILQGFSPDGRVVVATHVPHPVRYYQPAPEVSRWDATTGELLSRAELPCADPRALKAVRASADGRRAVVGEAKSLDPLDPNFYTGEWFLHDAVTGRRVAGPLAGVTIVAADPFSSDGRWVQGYRGDFNAKGITIEGLNIFDAADGKLVLELGKKDGLMARYCRFTPDGETAVISWVDNDRKGPGGGHNLQIIELPSGRERRRVVLPEWQWVRIDKWDGRYLQAVTREPDEQNGGSTLRAYTFDLTLDFVGEGTQDPFLVASQWGGGPTTFWIDGPERVAYFTILPAPPPPNWFDQCLAWLAAQTGTTHQPFNGPRMTARFVDRATGATRYELKQPLGHPPRVSPDGRLLACRGNDYAVEVWDVDPSPRWLWALGAGAVTSGVVLALGRLRRRTPAPREPVVA